MVGMSPPYDLMQAGCGGALVPLLWRSDGDRGSVSLSCRQGSAARRFAERDRDGQMLAVAFDRETDSVSGRADGKPPAARAATSSVRASIHCAGMRAEPASASAGS